MIHTIASTSPRIIDILNVTKSLFNRISLIDVLRNLAKRRADYPSNVIEQKDQNKKNRDWGQSPRPHNVAAIRMI